MGESNEFPQRVDFRPAWIALSSLCLHLSWEMYILSTEREGLIGEYRGVFTILTDRIEFCPKQIINNYWTRLSKIS